MYEILTVEDIAKDLRKTKRSIQRLARSGELPVSKIPRSTGYAYGVPLQTYLDWKKDRLKKQEENKLISGWDLLKKEIPTWLEWCEKGLLTGKPQAEHTLETNRRYLNYYFDNIPRRYRKTAIISLDNLRTLLGNIDPKSFSKKDNIYKAVRSYTKYLIAKKLSNENLLTELQKAKPKRLYPARRLHCTLEQFNRLLEEAGIKHHCQKPYDVILNKTIVATLGYTGLRASELCNLRMQDVDLTNKRIFVFLGKGKKNRYVGICNQLYEYLTEYLKARPKTNLDNFFVTISSSSRQPVPYTRKVLQRKIKRLSEIAGIDINVHGLRRTFATVAANAGKPINIISLALGHADLKTTQGYLMTSQDEVVREMQNW